MAKIQRINKGDDRFVYYINIPISIVEDLNFKKGDEVAFKTLSGKELRITKVN